MNQVVGIDLGTTNSAVARIIGSDPVVLPTEGGNRTMPSVVMFDSGGNSVHVGKEAENLKSKHPGRVIESVKRKMGSNEVVAQIGDTTYMPEEISALIIEKLLEFAEKNLGSPVTNAVITVPAYFSNKQREATKRAGQIAGISVDRIINEPTAAVLAYGIKRNKDSTVLVYDLGGGTFDASVVNAVDGVFEVVATDGISHHGGDDWDARIAAQIKRMIEDETGAKIEQGQEKMQRIWSAAKDAKHDLSSKKRTEIRLPYIKENYTFEESLTRKEFQEMTSDLLEDTITICRDVLSEAEVLVQDIDEIILVGGSTRMPQIKDRLEAAFHDQISRDNPDEVVAKGAAVQSAFISDSLPVVKENGSSRLKSRERQSIETDKSSEYSLPKKYDDAVLVDVNSNSLGIKTVGDNFVKIIRRNSSIPTKRTERIETIEDNQTTVKVEVYQGESMVASENELLDEFAFSGLPEMPAGEAKIDVTFRINKNCILEVEAESVQRGHTDSITIDSGINYTQDELEDISAGLPQVK